MNGLLGLIKAYIFLMIVASIIGMIWFFTKFG